MNAQTESKGVAMQNMTDKTPDLSSGFGRLARFILGLAVLAAIIGCQSQKPMSEKSVEPATNPQLQAILTNAMVNQAMAQAADSDKMVTLREGDILKITFPGSPSLNTVATIRKDGIVSLPLVGEIKAAGLTPDELDKKLIELYSPQLTTKEVSVEVQSSAFPIYVTGAVLRPGKIMSDHSITALEAVMEAGGFDYTKADMKHVVVIRKVADGTKNYVLDLKAVMDGKSGESFYLKPSDIIFVQEKFNWF